MGQDITYKQIYDVLFSDDIEEYVPDGTSISHPVIGICDGNIVDCFLLYAISRDGTKYSVPTARIIIDANQKRLIKYASTVESPFSVYNGTDYYQVEESEEDIAKNQKNEVKYQDAYLRVRKIAFAESVSDDDREAVADYIRTLKTVEFLHLQPFIFELGSSFFEWAKRALKR